MYRCLDLARLGTGNTAPNPIVGAVLVYEDRIIGEGYHKVYGEAHAEVNCIQSVKLEDQDLIRRSTLYVSLEPCAHFGKTPPCADLIISKNIPRVVIGCRDPFQEVNGKGIEKLKAAGVEVVSGVLEAECMEINKRFFTFHITHRPYIILKWAQSGNGKTGNSDHSRRLITNACSNRLVHKWRAEEMAIMVGTNTALYDDPELTTRLWPGKSPLRLVVDMNLRLPGHLKLFTTDTTTIVFNKYKHTLPLKKISFTDLRTFQLAYYQVTEDVNLVHQVTNALTQLNIQSLIIEGGTRLLQSFIDEGLWDEARVFTNQDLIIENGLAAPELKDHQLVSRKSIESDTLHIYQPIYS